jgi:hypothetical protein
MAMLGLMPRYAAAMIELNTWLTNLGCIAGVDRHYGTGHSR